MDLSLGPVCLVVTDLVPMLDFYVKEMGFMMKRSDGHLVELYSNDSSSEPLLILRYETKAERAPIDATGLYHFAILLPDRKSLAAAYLSLGSAGVIFDGYADHLVSEALYLTDPEGNGIEIYADRPRDAWKFDENGKIQMATEPLDIDSLIMEVSGTSQSSLKAFETGARLGHIHLKVANLERSIAFYQQLLEMNVVSYWGSAAFLSVGGYHHHIGMNTWESFGGPARAKDWSGIEYFTIKVGRKASSNLAAKLSNGAVAYSQDSERLFVADPDGIELLITPTD